MFRRWCVLREKSHAHCRYIRQEDQRSKLFEALINSKLEVERVLVTADINNVDLDKLLNLPGHPSVIQLHGNESIKR